MRIILLGKAGSGKDSVAYFLTNEYHFKRYAYADKLKRIALELYPTQFCEGKPRELLQVLGEKLREIDPYCWINYLHKEIERERPKAAVITDCRYKNEYEEALKFGFTPVFIECDDDIRLERLYARDGRYPKDVEAKHKTEDFKWLSEDIYIIKNNGSIKDLEYQVGVFIGGGERV